MDLIPKTLLEISIAIATSERPINVKTTTKVTTLASNTDTSTTNDNGNNDDDDQVVPIPLGLFDIDPPIETVLETTVTKMTSDSLIIVKLTIKPIPHLCFEHICVSHQ